jgi:nicotinamide-nucleotide amidase
MTPKLALISTGTELLRGRAVDTHLSTIAREMEPLGIEVGFHSTCPDDLGRLVEEIQLASSRAEVVILTGGLGPTEDDYTRRAAEIAFGRPLEFRPAAWKAIQARFRKFRIPIAPINRRQAFAPKGARLIPNPNGSAPGFEIADRGRLFFALPGPPREMVPMLRGPVIRRIGRRRKLRIWESSVYGLPEGGVDEIVAPIVAKNRDCSYGITVSGGMVHLSVKAERGSPDRVGAAIRKALGVCFVGRMTLAQAVAGLLLRKKMTIAVAESCTGGAIASRLTDVPGISASLLEACVCYSDASKASRLGVSPDLIRRHGAVSREVAAAMAEGAAAVAGADLAVATTGIAGPSGGTREKPVGLVWHAVHYRRRTRVERRVFPGDRLSVKERAANLALDMVRRTLLNA